MDNNSNSKIRPVFDSHDRYGLYLWQMPNGSFIGDDEGNFLNIASEYGSPKRIAQLTDAVRSYGIYEGEPVFFPGHRQVSDEEYARQKARLLDGLIPDDHDIGAFKDELKERKQ